MTALRQRRIDDMQLKGLSASIGKSVLHMVTIFALAVRVPLVF
jgi:hypothetical protein